MMSILGDVSLARAGLRDRAARPDRDGLAAEDYTTAGNLIPDELLDAFMLCGTREDVAAKAMAFHTEAGLGLPLLQPVLQEDHQIDELIAAAALYAASAGSVGPRCAGDAVTTVPLARDAAPTDDAPVADDRRLGLGGLVRRRGGGVWEILRPFAYTASVIPVLAGGALAAVDHAFTWLPFLAALFGGVFIHSGTNVVNEIYDVRKGSTRSPRRARATPSSRAASPSVAAFIVAPRRVRPSPSPSASTSSRLRGPAIVGLGLPAFGGYFYTAPPFEYKYQALGVPLVFLLMGPLMVEGSYFAMTGAWSIQALVVSIPVGLLVAAILDGNEWRDIGEDTRAGIRTLSGGIGKEYAHYLYVALVLGAYMALGLAVAFRPCRRRRSSRSCRCRSSPRSSAPPSSARPVRRGRSR